MLARPLSNRISFFHKLSSTHRNISKSSFKVVYGANPTNPLDLVPRSITKQFSGDADERAKQIKKLHESLKATIEKQNKRYMQAANKHRSIWSLMWVI